MNKLEQHLKALITESGPVNVATFMNLAIGHYYSTRDPFGASGDFTTAPEISQMFGEMIGVFLADAWIKMGAPSPVILCEAGPGRGTLMMDIMRGTNNVKGFHEAVQIHLIEMSPTLKEKQKEALQIFNVTWHETLSTLPAGPVLFVANEFLDALPITQIVWNGEQWMERRIGLQDDKFIFGLAPAQIAVPPLKLDPKSGDIFELSPVREEFARNLCLHIQQNKGVALLIDYGHDHSALGETLQAVKKHAYVDVLSDVGEADLTSHVDFDRIAHAATRLATVHGPVSQGDFLLNLGIEIRAAKLRKQRDVERLTGDDQMGRLFRVMAFCHTGTIKLAGFTT